MNVLEISNFSFSYFLEQPLLTDISMSLEEGEIYCLLGPNGSGKTTLISQILFPSESNKQNIKLSGKRICDISLVEQAKLVGYVPQKIVPLHISVIQTVIMGRYPYQKNIFLKPKDEDYQTAYKAIEQMGLTNLADRQLSTLSGGEVQRVFIAQSLAKNAKLYFFDEPMSALDPQYQSDFLSLINWLASQGKSVFFTTHNPNHLFSLKNARAGILDKSHQFTQLNKVAHEGTEKIQEVFGDSLSIEYSRKQGRFVSSFRF